RSVQSEIVAADKGAASVQLNWIDKDAAAQGYYILRSGDGATFSQVAVIGSGLTTTWTDSTVSSNAHYNYKVQSFNGGTTSETSTIVGTTTPLFAPTALSAGAVGGSSVQLNWTDNDASADG